MPAQLAPTPRMPSKRTVRASWARVIWPRSLQTNVCSLTLSAVQLRLDAADRLVELVEERRGPVYAEEAARRVFALRHAPLGLPPSRLREGGAGDDPRWAGGGGAVGLPAPPGADLPLEDATFVVVDLETTG